MSSEMLFQIFAMVVGTSGILTVVIKSIFDSRAKKLATQNEINIGRAATVNELDKKKTLADIKDDEQFKRQIIDTIIDKYVSQSDRVFKMFEDEFKELSNKISFLDKTMDKSYAQTENLKIQTKGFYEEYTNRLQRLEGITLGMLAIFNGLQNQENFIKLANHINSSTELSKEMEDIQSIMTQDPEVKKNNKI